MSAAPAAAADRLAEALRAHEAGRLDVAADIYMAVLGEDADNADALHLLGLVMKARGAFGEAVVLIRRAAERAPHLAAIWSNLGNTLAAAGDDAGAVAAYDRAIGIDPGVAAVWSARGAALGRLGDRAGADDAYGRALALDPADVTARHNAANRLLDGGDPAAAAALLRAVLADAPELAEAHYNLARALFTLGDWTTAARHYEHRWRTPGFPGRRRHADKPDWPGTPLAGTLVVHAEQGLGDTLQFAALLPLVRTLVSRVVLEVPPALVRLFGGFEGADAVVPAAEGPLEADAAIPLLGLVHRLGLGFGALPSAAGRLVAEPGRIEAWRARLGDDGRRIVTVTHHGNPASPVDAGRGVDLDALAPLAAVEGVRLVSVQKADAGRLEPYGEGWRVTGLPFVLEHPGPDLDAGPDAFVDTAAVMALAAAAVSTDTAAAHLAGGLGRPLHLLLKAVPDWRWGLHRPFTPFYPTARLHRQATAGDWAPVIASVAAALAAPDAPV